MSVLHRIFRIRPASDISADRDPDLERLSAVTDQTLIEHRQDFRAQLQKLESGTRVLRTMSGAMGMIRGAESG